MRLFAAGRNDSRNTDHEKDWDMREIITMECTECKERNYSTTKNKKTVTGRLELKKFCKRCRKHQVHKETK
jgi:large subunit ribosomal protein L33